MRTLRIPIAIQQTMVRSLREHLAKADLKLERRYTEPALVCQQCGTSADTAWLEKNEVRLSPVLLPENQQEFIDEVMPRELVHLLIWQHFGRVASHGKEWKWMMKNVPGVPARCTHHSELGSIRQNIFPYRCRCQQHQLTAHHRNRVVRGETTYRCVHCNDLLVAEK